MDTTSGTDWFKSFRSGDKNSTEVIWKLHLDQGSSHHYGGTVTGGHPQVEGSCPPSF